ncbi:uncharacterized protein LOC129588485 [Paramacrobiotus metropolitanus]|uniref:uncharacterized protein LOC129588485 n=1 Tax=Paramacrobiotus metropolitanus TaxID=2943436 RepID=UPI00244615D4|nr:uncharacterized protein LOC129588485 [Paramacrobiotus metropolitanus]
MPYFHPWLFCFCVTLRPDAQFSRRIYAMPAAVDRWISDIIHVPDTARQVPHSRCPAAARLHQFSKRPPKVNPTGSTELYRAWPNGLLPAAVLSAQCSQKLQVGSKGDCVKEVQRKVGTSADGIFGQSTQAAVKAFQRRHEEADGIVGANTWAVIHGSSGSGTGSASGGCGCDANRATQCTSGATPGAKNLASYLKNKFSGRTEIFNCRNVRGGSTVSLHGEGRAVDF